MDPNFQQEIGKRLRRAARLVRNVQQLIATEGCSLHSLHQLQVAQAELWAIKSMVVLDNLETRLSAGLSEQELDKRQIAIDEILTLFASTQPTH